MEKTQNGRPIHNLTSSKIIEDNPEQSIQGHVMYTGYLNSRGFFDESKFSTSLEKKLAGIIYHLLAQNKPVKETLTGKTSEVFKFFKMIYNTLKGFDVDGIKTLDELLDAMKGGDFDFNNPPYVDEIKRLSKVLLSNISRIKNLFGDRIIEPAIKAVIAHPYEYQEETIQKLIEKNIISEVEE